MAARAATHVPVTFGPQAESCEPTDDRRSAPRTHSTLDPAGSGCALSARAGHGRAKERAGAGRTGTEDRAHSRWPGGAFGCAREIGAAIIRAAFERGQATVVRLLNTKC